MRKYLKLAIIASLVFVTSCSTSNSTTNNGKDEIVNEDTKDEILNDISSAPFFAEAIQDIEVLDDASSDSTIAAYIRSGDQFEVYEVKDFDNVLYARIARNFWIVSNESNIKRIKTITKNNSLNILIPDFPKKIERTFQNGQKEIVDFVFNNDGTLSYVNSNGLIIPYIPFELSYLVFGDKINYTYNDKGLIIAESIDSSSYANAIAYSGNHEFEYDDNDNLISVVSDSKIPFSYEYDDNGRLIKATGIDNRQQNEKTAVIYSLEYNGTLAFQYVDNCDAWSTNKNSILTYRINGNRVLETFAYNGKPFAVAGTVVDVGLRSTSIYTY